MPGLGRCWNAQLLAPPLEHEVGIDAVLQCDRCDRGTGLFRESDQLADGARSILLSGAR